MSWLSFLLQTPPPNPQVARLIESIRSGVATLSYHPRIGTPILYLASGWSVSSVGNRLVSIPEIRVTPQEADQICSAIADRVAAMQAEAMKEGGGR